MFVLISDHIYEIFATVQYYDYLNLQIFRVDFRVLGKELLVVLVTLKIKATFQNQNLIQNININTSIKAR